MSSFVVVKNKKTPPYEFSEFHETEEEAASEAMRLHRKEDIPFVVLKVIGVAKDGSYFQKTENNRSNTISLN